MYLGHPSKTAANRRLFARATFARLQSDVHTATNRRLLQLHRPHGTFDEEIMVRSGKLSRCFRHTQSRHGMRKLRRDEIAGMTKHYTREGRRTARTRRNIADDRSMARMRRAQRCATKKQAERNGKLRRTNQTTTRHWSRFAHQHNGLAGASAPSLSSRRVD